MNYINTIIIAICLLYKYGVSEENKGDLLLKSIIYAMAILWAGWMIMYIILFPKDTLAYKVAEYFISYILTE